MVATTFMTELRFEPGTSSSNSLPLCYIDVNGNIIHVFAGLLAGLWEFPSLHLEAGKEKQQKAALIDHLRVWVDCDVVVQNLQYVGEVNTALHFV